MTELTQIVGVNREIGGSIGCTLYVRSIIQRKDRARLGLWGNREGWE